MTRWMIFIAELSKKTKKHLYIFKKMRGGGGGGVRKQDVFMPTGGGGRGGGCQKSLKVVLTRAL